MTLWDNLCCYGYGIHARWEALRHIMRGHQLRWRCDIDLWVGSMGCIVCEECPDTQPEYGKHVGLSIWSRNNRLIGWLGQQLCAWLGHPEHWHPQRWTGKKDAEGNLVMADIEGEWYCCRCAVDTKGPSPEQKM